MTAQKLNGIFREKYKTASNNIKYSTQKVLKYTKLLRNFRFYKFCLIFRYFKFLYIITILMSQKRVVTIKL